MSWEKIKRLISPYLDSELDVATTAEIEEYLDEHPNAREYFENEYKFEQSLKQTIVAEDQMVDAMFNRALSKAVAKPTPFAFALKPVFVSIIAVVFLFSGVFGAYWWKSDLAFAAIYSHGCYLRNERPLDIKSSNPQEIEAHFKGKFLFSVTVPDLDPQKYKLLGARSCDVGGSSVVYLVYEVQGSIVSVFLMDNASAGEFRQMDQDTFKQKNFVQKRLGIKNTVLCRQTGESLLTVVGDVSDEVLEEIAMAYNS